jgi:DNA-binding transcriptional MerR regulator
METSTMEREETAVRDLFARVDEVLDVAHSIEGERPQEAARLVHASHGALSAAEPVRVPIAAKILLVSDKTVRAWAQEGLLTSRAVRPRRLLDAERLHVVLRFLSDLRAAGQDRDFRDNLWNRLQDEALLDREDLAESQSEMNAGNVRPALTSDEERKARRNRR